MANLIQESNEVIYDNNNYQVEIGPSQVLEDAIVYLVRNRRTNVVEAEDSMLPRVIDYAKQLDEAVEELMGSDGLFSNPVH